MNRQLISWFMEIMNSLQREIDIFSSTAHIHVTSAQSQSRFTLHMNGCNAREMPGDLNCFRSCPAPTPSSEVGHHDFKLQF